MQKQLLTKSTTKHSATSCQINQQKTWQLLVKTTTRTCISYFFPNRLPEYSATSSDQPLEPSATRCQIKFSETSCKINHQNTQQRLVKPTTRTISSFLPNQPLEHSATHCHISHQNTQQPFAKSTTRTLSNSLPNQYQNTQQRLVKSTTRTLNNSMAN